uniref:signal recognition particle subunit SRP72-like n=1 Tax=Myxine glutinosa TaxID=7769 RepID=UPI00358FC173
MKESANYKIRHSRENEAVADLEQLWKQNPEDMKTLAQLISAYSQLDAQKAKKLSKYLPATDCISLKVDVDQLENSYGMTHMRKRNVKPMEKQLQPQAELGRKKKQKKKKKKGNSTSTAILLNVLSWDVCFENVVVVRICHHKLVCVSVCVCQCVCVTVSAPLRVLAQV